MQQSKKKQMALPRLKEGIKQMDSLNFALNFALNEAPGKNDELNKAATQRVTRSMGKQVDWSEEYLKISLISKLLFSSNYYRKLQIFRTFSILSTVKPFKCLTSVMVAWKKSLNKF